MAEGGIIIIGIIGVAVAIFTSMLVWLMKPEENEGEPAGDGLS